MEKLTKVRVNNIGLKYTITEESRYETLVTLGSRAMLMKISIEVFLACWYKWQVRGDFIQDAFSMLNDNEREFLMTGIDEEQWNTIFQEKEENEND